MNPGLFDRLLDAFQYPDGKKPSVQVSEPPAVRKKSGRPARGRTKHTVAIWIDQGTKVRMLKHKGGQDTWLDVITKLLDRFEAGEK